MCIYKGSFLTFFFYFLYHHVHQSAFIQAMSLLKPLPSSRLSRGAHLSHTESKSVALEIGTAIENAPRDEEGRIKLNPLIEKVEMSLGAPCTLYSFVEQKKLMFSKLAEYYGKNNEQVYKAKGGRYHSGTW